MKNDCNKLVKHRDYTWVLDLESLIGEIFTLFGCSMRWEASQPMIALSKMETEDITVTKANFGVVWVMGLFGVLGVEWNKVELQCIYLVIHVGFKFWVIQGLDFQEVVSVEEFHLNDNSVVMVTKPMTRVKFKHWSDLTRVVIFSN